MFVHNLVCTVSIWRGIIGVHDRLFSFVDPMTNTQIIVTNKGGKINTTEVTQLERGRQSPIKNQEDIFTGKLDFARQEEMMYSVI